MKVLEDGVQTYEGPNFPQLRTLPVRSRWRWSPMIGQENGADHFPTVASVPAAVTDAETPVTPQGSDSFMRRATLTSS